MITEHGRPVIKMAPAEQSVSPLADLMAENKLRRAVSPGSMPELIDDLAEMPSLSDLLRAERDEERQ